MAKSKAHAGPKPAQAPTAKSARGKATTRSPSHQGRNRAARRRGEKQPWWQRPQAIVALIAVVVVAGIAFQALRSKSGSSGSSVGPTFAAANGGVTEGASSAKVTVVEYGDFQCPNCGNLQKAVGPTIDKLVADGTIRFTYVPMAFLGTESDLASNAAYCAGDQGKFWEYHDYLFAHQAAENSGALIDTSLTSYGNAVGVTSNTFATCVKDQTYQSFVKHVTDLASQKGVNQTPTLFINGTRAPVSAFTAAGFETAVKAAAGG